MFGPGHYGMVLLLYSIVGYALLVKRYDDHAVAGAPLVVLVTMTPDWDTYVGWLPHRGPTHTVWFALVVGAVLGAIVILDGRRRGQNPRTVAGLGLWASGLGTLSVVAHLVADALNPAGVRPFYPVSDYLLTFDLTVAWSPAANFGLLALGVLAVVGCWQVVSDRANHDVPALSAVVRRVYRYVRGPDPK